MGQGRLIVAFDFGTTEFRGLVTETLENGNLELVGWAQEKAEGFQDGDFIDLAAGARCRIRFQVDTSVLGYYDRDMRFAVDPGEVEVMVGASSRDIRLRSTLVLQGERRPLKQQQVLATQVEVTHE